MIQKVIIPEKADFNMAVTLPSEYVGREVKVIFFIDGEVKKANASVLPKRKPSDFFGTLSEVDGAKMHAYITQTRNEWERNS